jgi:putative ABC transport system permease protein
MRWQIAEAQAMRSFQHAWLLTVAAIHGIPQRLGTSLLTVISMLTVMAVLVAMLSLSEGLEEFFQADVRPDNVVVLSRGSHSTFDSSLGKSAFDKIRDTPGIRRDASGKPEAAATATLFINVVNQQNHRATVGLLAVTPEWLTMNPAVRITQGRFFHPGVHELIVSERVRALFRRCKVGDEVRVRGTPWKVVGVYSSTYTLVQESAIGDADTVVAAFPQSTYNTVNVVIESVDAIAKFRSTIGSDPTLAAVVKTQAQSNEDLIRSRRSLLDFISYFLGSLMGLGAACGALASLYASVDARTIEIATLRAIGFGGMPVVVSVLAEGLLLAIPAALLGAGIDWYLFNRHIVMAAQITFPMAVTTHLIGIALCWALAIALIGGILPSIRAARLPVAAAMRAG